MTIAWSTAALYDEQGNVTQRHLRRPRRHRAQAVEIELDRERDFLSKVTDITPAC